jgi:hypothetical protein
MSRKMGLSNLNINQKSSQEICVFEQTLAYLHATNRSYV